MEWNKNTMRWESFNYSIFDKLNEDEFLYICDRITRCKCISTLVKTKQLPIEMALHCAISYRWKHGIDEKCDFPEHNQPERSKRDDLQHTSDCHIWIKHNCWHPYKSFCEYKEDCDLIVGCRMRCSEHCGNTVRDK